MIAIPRIQTILSRPISPPSSSTTSPIAETTKHTRPMDFGLVGGSFWNTEQEKPTTTIAYGNFSQADTAALNAAVYGYGGYGVLTPGGGAQAQVFWDERTIDQVVTKSFIRSHFSEKKKEGKKLDEKIDPTDELTDSTYVEWICERARRFFIILVELGIKEHIFEIVDAAWDDGDLPLPAHTLPRLKLGTSMEKRFYRKQFEVLVKALEKGDHVEYDDDELVPLDVIDKKSITAGAKSAPNVVVEKAQCRKNRARLYVRIRIPVPKVKKERIVDEYDSEEDIESVMTMDSAAKRAFLDMVEFYRTLDHPHIQTLHASYIHQEFGYTLLSPVTDCNIRQFIQNPPLTYKNLEKPKRKETIIRWMHCLISAVNYLHSQGIPHSHITPRSVQITSHTHEIVLTEISRTPIRPSSPSTDIELYEYGAPELWIRSMASMESSTSIPSSARSQRLDSIASNSTSSTSPPASFSVGSWSTSDMSALTSSKPAIFSLGAIYLDILTFALKRKISAFGSHRSAKNHRPRMSGRADSSFHANIPQVETWIEQLEKDAKKKAWCAVREALVTARGMLRRDPCDRISGTEVERQIRRIVELEAMAMCVCVSAARDAEKEMLREDIRRKRETCKTAVSTETEGSVASVVSAAGSFIFWDDSLGGIGEKLSAVTMRSSDESVSDKIGYAL